MRHSAIKPVRGFSLIEMAVVLIVLVLLLGGALVPLSTQVEQRRIAETENTLEEAKEALIGFALANSRLPCPDTDGNGASDPLGAGQCPNYEGNLPWVTLNLAVGDSWGRNFRYRVSPGFTDAPVFPCDTVPNPPTKPTGDYNIGLCDVGDINITTRDSNKVVQSLATGVAAIIISYGENGFNARTETGVLLPPPPALNVDEAKNNAGPNYFTRTITPVRTPCSDTAVGAYCEFDDIVVWLSPSVLFNRMVAAQRLP